jgi:DNA-binding GntR family transcriptional regulator
MITIAREHSSDIALREHAAIVDAVLDGNSRLAARLMRQHVADSLARIREAAD